jgi:uncharacterized cupredoxin-like copper-binding protein
VRPLRAATAAVVAVAALTAGILVAGHAAAGANAPARTLGPGPVTVNITIHHSHFNPDRISVAPGTTVRFVIDNTDPINHEFIVGDDEVQRRHEAGTEPYHPPRPGEVSVPALTTAETTFVFDNPSSVMYACHLPGHFRYGMSGYVEVVAR